MRWIDVRLWVCSWRWYGSVEDVGLVDAVWRYDMLVPMQWSSHWGSWVTARRVCRQGGLRHVCIQQIGLRCFLELWNHLGTADWCRKWTLKVFESDVIWIEFLKIIRNKCVTNYFHESTREFDWMVLSQEVKLISLRGRVRRDFCPFEYRDDLWAQRSTTDMNTDLHEDKGLASSPDGRDVKLEIISEANANSLVSTSVCGEHQHTKIVDSASALRAQGNSKGAFDLSAIEVGEIEFY